MDLRKVVFGFVVLFAATLNFGYFIGDIADPRLHSTYMLTAAVAINLIATLLKFGDHTHLGATHLATSIVASLQLISATIVWAVATDLGSIAMTRETTPIVVSISGGALFANVASVTLLIYETTSFSRR